MTGQGECPLNSVGLPECRPIYGGTYFPPEHWKQFLQKLVARWDENPQLANDYAERLTAGIQQSEQLPLVQIPDAYAKEDLTRIVTPWKERFDKRSEEHTSELQSLMPLSSDVFCLKNKKKL